MASVRKVFFSFFRAAEPSCFKEVVESPWYGSCAWFEMEGGVPPPATLPARSASHNDPPAALRAAVRAGAGGARPSSPCCSAAPDFALRASSGKLSAEEINKGFDLRRQSAGATTAAGGYRPTPPPSAKSLSNNLIEADPDNRRWTAGSMPAYPDLEPAVLGG